MSVEDRKEDSKKKITTWPQWLAACALSLSVIGGGLANGWASPYLARLTSTEGNPPLRLSDHEASWVASLLNLGRVSGVLLSVLCQDYIGRKKVLLLGGIPAIAGWICNICSTSAMWLYISRFCAGIGTGMTWSTLPIYLSEIAHPTVRGSLIAMNVNAYSTGTFLANALGPYLSIEVFGYVSLIPNIVFMIVFFSLIPESPYDHLLQGHIEKAEASLKWFRRESDVTAEMQDLQEFVAGAQANFFLKFKEFLIPKNLRKLLLVIGACIFCYIGGYSAIIYYAEIILTKSKITIKPSLVVMILGLIMIIAGSMAMFLVDKLGRKRLLIFSATGASFSLILLGTHFHLLSLNSDPGNLTWLAITAMLLYNLSLAVGILPIPHTLMGEMFSVNMKNVASFGVNTCVALAAFVCAKSYQPYLDLVGDKFVYWTYGIGILVMVPYVYFLVPETAGKTLLEIQRSTKK